MPYTKTTWVNGTSPAINATNLNNLETQYDTAESDFKPITGSMSTSTASWTVTTVTGFSYEKEVTINEADTTLTPFVNFTTDTYSIAQDAGITLVTSTVSAVILYATATPSDTVSFDYVFIKA